MLPDYPVVKDKYSRIMGIGMQMHAKQGLVGTMGIGTRIIHEGDRFSVQHEDGTIESKPFFTAKSMMEIRVDEYNDMTQTDVLERVSDVADDLLAQRDRHIIHTLDEVVEKAGNVYDVKGDPDRFIDALSGMDFEFDDGNPGPVLIVHPSTLPKAKELLRRIETDPRLKKRMDVLMDNKRREWNDREALRKLVG